MEQKEIIETIGSITKYENLSVLTHEVLENTLVLQSTDPFPGFEYHGKKDLFKKPHAYYIILRYRYAPEKINRITKLFSLRNQFDCYPSFGEITTKDSVYPCIRIKGIEEATLIPKIQNFFKKNELQLMAKRNFRNPSRVKIFKTFRLMEIYEGVYRDMNEGEKIYLKIPKQINWKRFSYINKRVKAELENPNFDAALGVIYRFCGPEDVIRIYDSDKTLKRALTLKKLYSKEIKSEIYLSANV